MPLTVISTPQFDHMLVRATCRTYHVAVTPLEKVICTREKRKNTKLKKKQNDISVSQEHRASTSNKKKKTTAKI